MNNRYGLDTHYFKKKLKLILRDVEMYTPDEMFTELTRLAGVAGRDKDSKSEEEARTLVRSILKSDE